MDTKDSSFEVTIEKLVHGGSGFARHEGKVVFVPFSVPGDRLLVRKAEEKKAFCRAEIVRVIEPGPGRVAPRCPYFGTCGGCQLQQIDYCRQVESKREILEEAFHHRFPETGGLPIVMKACPQPYGYRSRARIKVRGSGSEATVGFYQCGSHTIVDVERCPLFRDALNEALSFVRRSQQSREADPRPREMDLACSEEEGIWITSSPEKELTNAATGQQSRNFLQRKVGEFTYSVEASAFFQANDFMIHELVDLVTEFVAGTGSGSALDLYSGVGLFSLPLARLFASVEAVESSEDAVRLCRQNAASAGIENIRAVCAGVSDWIRSQNRASRRYDLILLDPPRAGAERIVMETIREWSPAHILYVSCDPQTLVRDLSRICPAPYKIAQIVGLDMFPQTYHFETVVKLEKAP